MRSSYNPGGAPSSSGMFSSQQQGGYQPAPSYTSSQQQGGYPQAVHIHSGTGSTQVSGSSVSHGGVFTQRHYHTHVDTYGPPGSCCNIL